jgi:hypothetical protein
MNSIFQYSDINYTDEQRAALNKVVDLIETYKVSVTELSKELKNSKLEELLLKSTIHHLINGFAGTGKTTMAKNIIFYAKDENCFDAIYVLAPTNRAKGVIESKMIDLIGSFAPMTIHKFLYGSPTKDEQGEISWNRSANHIRILVLIDESSMIDEKLENDIINSCKNALVIYMGDSFQLEQIGNKSSIFKLPVSTLTEVKRNENNVLAWATYLRTHKQAVYPKSDVKNITITDKFVSTQNFVDGFKANKNYNAVFIVATNKTRNKINETVRNRLGYQSVIETGERLISITNSIDYTNGELFYAPQGEILKEVVFSILNRYDEYDVIGYLVRFPNYYAVFIPSIDKAGFNHFEISDSIGFTDVFGKWDSEFIEYNKAARKLVLKKEVLILTYGYAMSAHKS